MADGKTCPQCGVWKLRAEYKKRKITKKSKSGMNSECKACEKIRNARHYQNNKEKAAESSRAWRAANKERKRAADTAWRNANADKVLASQKKWYATDPLAKENKAAYSKKWRAENPEKVKEIIKKSTAKRQSRPEVRVNNAIGRAMRASLGKGEKAGRKTFAILGYSKKELMTHLEKQFQPGMTWENYGLNGWHIDHIIPKSIFNYKTTDDIDFKRCWALNNLQPMWATDNRKKYAKYDKPFQPSLALATPANDNKKEETDVA